MDKNKTVEIQLIKNQCLKIMENLNNKEFKHYLNLLNSITDLDYTTNMDMLYSLKSHLEHLTKKQ